MPLVSVIVSVYNTMQWLAECVESIRSQTLSDIEIILVDDGSTDYSGAICDAYAEMDSRILVLHQENKGDSSAKNAGMACALGTYIMFCDSDDYMAPEWCTSAVELAQQYPEAMVSLTFADVDISGIHPSIYSEEEEVTVFRRGEYLKFLKSKYPFNVSSKIFQMAILKEYNLKFEEAVSFGEDFCFVASYLEKMRYIVLKNSKPLCFYRRWSTETLSSRFLGMRCFSFYQRENEILGRFIKESEKNEFRNWFFWTRGLSGLRHVLDPRNPEPLEKQKADCQEIVSSSEFREWCEAAVPEETANPMLRALRQGNFYDAYEPFMQWLKEE
ncbi:MAG: glycosyltransferase [Lachnospiraceae bacterium]|nr:glycosyltransferase [Lachnospiraceae bacterium]